MSTKCLVNAPKKSRRIGSGRTVKFVDQEQLLHQYVLEMRSNGLAVTIVLKIQHIIQQ